MRILGVDPGSRLTGYGCIDLIGNQIRHVSHGTLKLANTSGKATIPLEERLFSIYEGLSKVIEELRPQVMAIEKVFFAKNAVSALKLGQARGAAMLTGRIYELQIFEYSPNEVKQAIVGQGHADKDQVAKMVQLLIGKQEFETSDASDGLALAICHAHAAQPMKNKVSVPAKKARKSGSLADALGISAESISSNQRRLDLSKGRPGGKC